jgi:hypothetical protein
MNVLLVICIIAAIIATVVALVRGITAFLKTTEADLNNPNGPSQSSLKQNKMMMMRITFQAIAIFFIALLLLLHGK